MQQINPSHMEEELKSVDKGHFKKWYFQKEFMEEMLKSKNMMNGAKK